MDKKVEILILNVGDYIKDYKKREYMIINMYKSTETNEILYKCLDLGGNHFNSEYLTKNQIEGKLDFTIRNTK